MLEIGSVLEGKYKILNEIGHGGMSVVYLALNERANKTWAIKEVRKDGGNDSEVVSQGLVAETEMLKKLSHPNLPSIIDVIDRADSFIIVMDYIEGKSLQSVLNHSGPQAPDQVVAWASQLCDVLGYLHSRKPPIIYRDMKPANVMLRPDGKVALIDFGTAREYKQHSQGDTTWLGTRGYAAPEQFGGRGQTDARTDIYCLGATMYHLLTGYSPADTQFVVLPLGQLRPELSGSGIEKVVAKCCEPDPLNRYQSCAELMYALEHVHDDDDATRRERNRMWRTFVTGCVIALVGVAGIIGCSAMRNRTTSRLYESNLREAQNSATFQEAVDEGYAEAMKLMPEEPRAYNMMLDAIISNDSDEAETITQEEKAAMEQALLANNKEGKPNLSIFAEQSADEYARFEYRRGVSYFANFEGSKAAAYEPLNTVKDSAALGETQQKVASCLCMLASVYKNQGGSGWDQQIVEQTVDYGEIWRELTELAGDPQTTEANCGGQISALTICREIANQLAMRPTEYQNAKIGAAEMQKLLRAAADYIEHVTPEGEAEQSLVVKGKEAIQSADAAMESLYGQTVRADRAQAGAQQEEDR